MVRGQSGPGQSGHSPNAGAGPVGDYDYVFDLDGDGGADFYDGPLGARPAVPGFEPLGEPRPGLVTKKRNEIGFSPLPRCTYLNTDIYGDDVGDGKGISTGTVFMSSCLYVSLSIGLSLLLLKAQLQVAKKPVQN